LSKKIFFSLHSHVDKGNLWKFSSDGLLFIFLCYFFSSVGLRKFTQEWPTEAIKAKIQHDTFFKKQKRESTSFTGMENVAHLVSDGRKRVLEK
jgi:hypothetical protein